MYRNLISQRRQTLRAEQGFTLVELMVVVAILLVLTTVATVAYQKHITSGRLVKVMAFMTELQGAEETYFQQFGSYFDASAAGTSSAQSFHPPLQAGIEPFSKAWGSPGVLSTLGVSPDGGSTFGTFFVHASLPAQNHALYGAASTLGIPAQPTTPGATPHPWYYIVGQMDMDGDQTNYPSGGCTGGSASTVCTVLTSTSVASSVIVRNEGK